MTAKYFSQRIQKRYAHGDEYIDSNQFVIRDVNGGAFYYERFNSDNMNDNTIKVELRKADELILSVDKDSTRDAAGVVNFKAGTYFFRFYCAQALYRTVNGNLIVEDFTGVKYPIEGTAKDILDLGKIGTDNRRNFVFMSDESDKTTSIELQLYIDNEWRTHLNLQPNIQLIESLPFNREYRVVFNSSEASEQTIKGIFYMKTMIK